jgi:TPR repeat protein
MKTIPEKTMGKLWGHFARTIIAGIAIAVVSAIMVSLTPFQARASAAQAIDPQLLARAKAGDIDSQMRLASFYAKGEGIPQDFAEAAKWLRRAADQGNGRAAFYLGVYNHRGQGVPQDDSQAVLWYTKAAAHGDAEAEYALGSHYERGEGVSKDSTQAIEWYRKSAEKDFAKAQFHLGELYDSGQLVPRDEGIAAAWFSQAAQHGSLYAQTRLEWLRKEQASRLESRDRAITAAVWICVALFIVFLLRRYRATLLNLGRTLKPRTTRAKQLAILLIAASWCTACCIYQLWDMWHPVEAAVRALLLCAPAVVFGAAGFWWLSQSASNEKSDLND